MKLINKLFIMAAAVSTLSGCRPDLLDTKPYDKASAKTMWTNENFCQLGINSIYTRLRSGWVAKDAYILEAHGVGGSYRDNDHTLLAGNASPSSGVFSGYWGQHYYGVYLANDAVQNLPNAQIDDKTKGRMLAEAKTLRAFFYYKLNSVFKGVPYYDTTFNLDEAYKARESEETIWQKCIEDLTAAINEPNFPDRYKAGSAEWGRVNKSVAYALRGKCYMWTKDWAKAEADFRQLSTLGCDLFQGGYKQLFKEANEQSSEAIFSLQCIDGNGSTYGNSMSFRYGGRTTYGSCWSSCPVSTDFVDSYENIDGSKFDWKTYIPEFYTIEEKDREVFFLRNSDEQFLKDQLAAIDCPADKIDAIIEKVKKSVNDRLSQFSQEAQALYLPAGNEQRLMKAFDSRDPRLKQTVITPYSEYLGSASNKDHTYISRWPYVGNDADFPWDVRTDTQKDFFYMFRKFVAEGTSEMTGREWSPIDLPIIRYASCLINLAEALNEQGKTDEAVEVLNKVRQRAGVALLNSNEATKVNGKEDMRKRIQNEFRWETAGEGVDFYEEMRWGTWKESKFNNADNTAGLKEPWGTIIYPFTWGGDHYYKWAIPKKDTDMNPDLEQNPGWI